MKRKMIRKKQNKKKNDKKRVKRKRNEELEEFQEKFILSCLQLVWLLSSIEFEFHATRLLPSILTWIITPRWTSMVKICHEFPIVPATKISLQIIFELPTHFVSVSILCSITNFLPELFFLPTIPNPSTILAQFFISRKLSRDFEKEQIRFKWLNQNNVMNEFFQNIIAIFVVRSNWLRIPICLISSFFPSEGIDRFRVRYNVNEILT